MDFTNPMSESDLYKKVKSLRYRSELAAIIRPKTELLYQLGGKIVPRLPFCSSIKWRLWISTWPGIAVCSRCAL